MKKKSAPRRTQKSKAQSHKPFNWKSFEERIGKYYLQIIGMVVFLFGMGFLLKYAIDLNLIAPAFVVALGIVIASALVAGAMYLPKKFALWTDACFGGGFALYYVSIYAAYAIYHLIPLAGAVAGFVATSAFAAIASWRYNSFTISYFSLLGAFMTPFVLDVAAIHPLFTVAYFALVGASAITIAYQRGWPSHLFTAMILFVKYYYSSTMSFFPVHAVMDTQSALLYIGVFFFLFNLVPFYFALCRLAKEQLKDIAAVVISSMCVFAMFGRIGALEFLPQPLMNCLAPWTHLVITLGGIALLQLLLVIKQQGKHLMSGALFFLAVGYFSSIMVYQFYKPLVLQEVILHLVLLFSLLYCVMIRAKGAAVVSAALWVTLFTPQAFKQLLDMGLQTEPAMRDMLVYGAAGATIALLLVACGVLRQQKRVSDVTMNLVDGGALVAMFYALFLLPVMPFYYVVSCMALAAATLAWGLYEKNAFLRTGAYCLSAWGLLLFLRVYNTALHSDQYMMQLHIMFGAVTALVAFMFFTLRMHLKRLTPSEMPIYKVSIATAALLPVLWGKMQVLWSTGIWKSEGLLSGAHRVASSDLYQTTLAGYYSLMAVVLIVVGLMLREHIVRYCGFVLIALCLHRLFGVVMAMPEPLHRVVVFLVAGVVITIASFLYQFLSKKLLK